MQIPARIPRNERPDRWNSIDLGEVLFPFFSNFFKYEKLMERRNFLNGADERTKRRVRAPTGKFVSGPLPQLSRGRSTHESARNNAILQ